MVAMLPLAPRCTAHAPAAYPFQSRSIHALRHRLARGRTPLLCAVVLTGAAIFAAAGIAAAQDIVWSAEAGGIVFQTLEPEDIESMAEETGMKAGVLVIEVKPGSPAAAAGIQAPDFIVTIDGKPVSAADQAAEALKATRGAVQIIAFTLGDTGYERKAYTVNMPVGAAAPPAAPTGTTAPAAPAGPAAPGGTSPGASAFAGSQSQAGPGGPGWTLAQADAATLGQVKGATGRQSALIVQHVAPGSPAANAGVQQGDVVVALTAGVTTVQSLSRLLGAAEGEVEVLALRPGQTGLEPVRITLGAAPAETPTATLPAATAPATGTPAGGDLAAAIAGIMAPQAETATDPVNAYFDMMDFVRTQAWGTQISTTPAERQRVGALLQQAMPELDAESRAAIGQIPQVWASLQQMWDGFNEQNKANQREFWRKQLLLPTQFFPPPPNPVPFQAQGGRISFQYPGDWVRSATQDDDSQYWYFGPPGTQTTWQQVMDAANSPGGAVFVLTPIDEEIRQIGTYVEGARILARNYVTRGAPGFEEIFALDDEQSGGLIVLRGRFPGQAEEKFFWIGDVRFGPDHYLAITFGGPVSEANNLVPTFYNILQTMDLQPPDPGGGAGYTGFALGAEMVRNATMSSGWYAQNHGG